MSKTSSGLVPARGVRAANSGSPVAQPRDGHRLRHYPSQPYPDLPEQRITRVVPERVIDVLELVQVHQQYRDTAAGAVLQALVQTAAEQHAIGEPGEGVVSGVVAEPVDQLPVAQRHAQMRRDQFEQLKVDALEAVRLAEPVTHQQVAQRTVLTAQRNCRRVTKSPSGEPVPGGGVARVPGDQQAAVGSQG